MKISKLVAFLAGLGSTVALPVIAATFNLFQPAAGILVGSTSTYVTTAAVSSNVISLWTGTCSSGTFLRGDGACQAPSGGTPGGSTTQVQYNNAGAFGGSAEFVFDGTRTVTLGSANNTGVIQAPQTTAGGAAGGGLSLLGGPGGSSGATAGAVAIQAGAGGGAAANGGAITITGGTAHTSGTGGLVTLLGGSRGTGGTGGSVAITGNAGNGAGVGGGVTLTGGAGGATNANGGAVTLISGAPGGAGTAGAVVLDAGGSADELTVTTTAVTSTVLVATPASTTGSAGLRIVPGVAPTSPVDGDIWTTTAGVFARINGATVQLATVP